MAPMLLPLAKMSILNYLRSLTPIGWILISVFFLLIVLSLYSQFRKRRSNEN